MDFGTFFAVGALGLFAVIFLGGAIAGLLILWGSDWNG